MITSQFRGNYLDGEEGDDEDNKDSEGDLQFFSIVLFFLFEVLKEILMSWHIFILLFFCLSKYSLNIFFRISRLAWLH